MSRRKLVILITSRGRKGIIILFLAVVLTTVLASGALSARFSSGTLEGARIIIDPGHGGVDGGTNDGSSFLEKDVNLQIALRLYDILKANKAIVEMTRYNDIALDKTNNLSSSRHKRDLLARVNRFNSGKFDVFISIHVNRSSRSSAIGPMTLYSPNFPSTSLLAGCIQDSLNEHAMNVYNLNLKRNPIKSQYFILKYSNIPGIIVETGFISNTREKMLLKEANYQEKLAYAIYEGIADYYNIIKNINAEPQKESSDDNKEDEAPTNTNELILVKKQ